MWYFSVYEMCVRVCVCANCYCHVCACARVRKNEGAAGGSLCVYCLGVQWTSSKLLFWRWVACMEKRNVIISPPTPQRFGSRPCVAATLGMNCRASVPLGLGGHGWMENFLCPFFKCCLGVGCVGRRCVCANSRAKLMPLAVCISLLFVYIVLLIHCWPWHLHFVNYSKAKIGWLFFSYSIC